MYHVGARCIMVESSCILKHLGRLVLPKREMARLASPDVDHDYVNSSHQSPILPQHSKEYSFTYRNTFVFEAQISVLHEG